MQQLTLKNGITMPALGFGVFQVDPAECTRVTLEALDAGYRLIDTASVYGNESQIGEALRQTSIERKEVFLATKLWVGFMNYEAATAAIERQLNRLQTDYLDLYLIHWPFGDIYGAWRAMQEAHKAGKIRAIGVSNFLPQRLIDFTLTHDIPPAVNQIEINPFLQQRDAVKLMQEENIAVQAWSPFAQGRNGVFEHPVLQAIAQQHGKTVGQVILRWLNQRGTVSLARTVNKARMQENLAIFDFELSAGDMAQIATLDTGTPSFGASPGDVETVRRLHRITSE